MSFIVNLGMEKIVEILKVVLSSKLLGASLGEVANVLGYKGRSTLYRIINSSASERAVATFCQKLYEKLSIDEDSLKCMMAAITNTEYLCRLLKPFMNFKEPYSVQAVVDAFLSRDFAIFPEDFKQRHLKGLSILEQDDPEAFFNMLALFYYRYSSVEYYVKGETHKQRCSRVLETLGKRLIENYPENDMAALQVYSYSKADIYNSEAPILWSLIRSLSALLQSYGQPIDLVSDIHFLSLPHNRDYWDTGSKNELILTNAYPTIIADNYTYDVFRADLKENTIQYLGNMGFLSDEILSFYSASQKTAKLAVYKFDDAKLSMYWENPNDDPTTAGNKWILLDKKNSQTLNNFDKTLDNEHLFAIKLKKEGFRKKAGYEIVDVTLSRERMTLKFAHNCSLSIPIAEIPFLKSIKPNFIVGVYERESDNRNFVWWPQIMHCLPLELFEEVEC